MRTATDAPRDHTVSLVLAWALVGIPLIWGVYETVLNAMQLFR